MVIARCVLCGKKYKIKKGQLPSHIPCRCGGKLKVIITPKVDLSSKKISKKTRRKKMIHCTKCKTNFQGRPVYCPGCGARLIYETSTTSSNTVNRPKSNKNVSNPKIIITLVNILSAILLIIVSLFKGLGKAQKTQKKRRRKEW